MTTRQRGGTNTSSPRNRTKPGLPFGFIFISLAAILSGCHLFLSTSTLERRDTQALAPALLYTNETNARHYEHTQQLESLQEQIKSLQAKVERRAKTEDLLALQEQVTNLSQQERQRSEEFCVPWHVSMDGWWTHHVDWEMGRENRTHYCFTPILENEKAAFLRRLYENQFHGDCSSVKTKKMLNAGFGADLDHIIDGLLFGLQNNRPVAIHEEGHWHYAANKDILGSKPTCPTKDFYCYFLNLTKCSPKPKKMFKGSFLTEGYQKQESFGRWMLEYAMRPQTWLRHAVYKYAFQSIRMQTPCTVMHVRRSDIVLHGKWSRRYRAIEEYVNAMNKYTRHSNNNNSTTNILLLTDDANAIGEATTQFPQYNWMYLDRKRHKGAKGGFENQVPSKNPKQETIVIMSILKLVRQCSSLIHTSGNFAELLIGEMASARGFQRVNLDEVDKENELFSEKNSLTANLSKSFS